MIKELVKDDAILSQVCERATPEDAELAQDLIDTAASLEDCSCLAANQIGVTKAVFVYFDDDQKPHVMYNPKVLMGLRPSKTVEGCLSHDDFSKVTRYAKIKVSYDELREYFPTVKSLDDLPRAVVESARLKGENLLNSYLRYRIVRKRQTEKEALAEQNAEQSSVGSQKSAAGSGDDAFLKALWGR